MKSLYSIKQNWNREGKKGDKDVDEACNNGICMDFTLVTPPNEIESLSTLNSMRYKYHTL